MTERPLDEPGLPMGQVDIDLASESLFLSSSLPIEVRDSRLRLVARATGTGTIDLPVGLYEVSAVLGDGQRHNAFAHVKEGSPTPVQLGPGSPAMSSSGDDVARSPTEADAVSVETMAPYTRARYTEAMAQTREEPTTGSDRPDLELLEVVGASVVERRRTRISFRCDPSIAAVPTAVVRIGELRQRVSLPISPEISTPSGGCVVKTEWTSGGHHAQAWISPERTVANGLQNMLSAGYVLEAAQIAREAVELLGGKYQDPAGAALGALLLHRAGLLARWESWVNNLAEDFPWLPDGKVLLVQLRVGRGEQTDTDLQLLIDASAQRVLFAETCSILIDLLRRWPGIRSRPEHQAAVERLTKDAPDIDRDSICLTITLPSGEA